MNIESRKEDNFQFDVDLITKGSLNFDLTFQGSTLSFEEEESLGVIRKINVAGTLERVIEDIFLEGRIILSASFCCARCIKQFDREMNFKLKASFKKESSSDEDSSEYEEDTESYQYHGKAINILPAIRDQISLSMPMKSLCSEECKGLCQTCGIDLNKEKCDCEEEAIDPRFEALKKIGKKVT